jgi:predicted nucleotidyltransferase component of viral defense system
MTVNLEMQRVELFHLHVLRLLCAGPDKIHLALKGGCNMRFFFGSVRYSQDMDIDVAQKMEAHVLREKFDRLLAGPALAMSLRAAGMDLGHVSAPKQTDTTQRWKIGLVPRDRARIELHTKVEFSRRPTTESAVLRAVSSDVIASYQLLPLLVRHYPLEAALRQKVRALVGRASVQARDVFDLAVLMARAGERATQALQPEIGVLPQAVERAMEVSFDDFQGQVVAYLHPAHAPMYTARSSWNALQARVVEALQEALP